MKKYRVTRDISAILTALAPAKEHAEDLFERAFETIDFRIHGRGMSKFKEELFEGKKVNNSPIWIS